MVTFRQLKYFDALAHHLHFGRAAEQCAISQPALSMQIRELEAALGVELIERRAGKVALTAIGAEVARRAERILAATQDLVDVARHGSRLLSGPLRLGVIPSVAPYLLPPLLPLLRERHPDLELHIRETQTSGLVRELAVGQLDLLVLALPVEHAEIETLPLLEDRFLLALPAARTIARRLRATPELLAHDRLLLLEEGHCLREQALSYCGMHNVRGIDTFGASTLSTIVQMVSNGYGITLLPELCVELERRHGDIRLMRFAEPEPHRTLGLAWRRSSPRKRDFMELGRFVTAVGEDLKRRSKAD
ncbi:MAG TPA: LysR substrate-binding domain-containing protein [Hyphomicrobiaceae bacterium]|nr:LysR substrate-binding domain-containing protein [Hyphomicrobiaceae bacterium]